MPAVVLRHPELPGQPIIVDVPVGSYVSSDYRDAGWQIDGDTSGEDAGVESTATLEAAAVQAQEAANKFVPEFPPDSGADDPKASKKLAPTPAPQSPPVPAGTNKEN